jgi:hypothetical protein
MFWAYQFWAKDNYIPMELPFKFCTCEIVNKKFNMLKEIAVCVVRSFV